MISSSLPFFVFILYITEFLKERNPGKFISELQQTDFKSLSSSRIHFTERVTQSATQSSDLSLAAWEEGVLLINTMEANLAVKIASAENSF